MALPYPDTSAVQPFLEFCHSLDTCGSLDEVARLALDETLRCLGAERGGVFVQSGTEFVPVATTNLSGATAIAVGSALRRWYADAASPVIARVGALDEDSSVTDPELAQAGACTFACVPLASGAAIRGALYFDHILPSKGFPDDTAFLLKTIAHFAAPVIERLGRLNDGKHAGIAPPEEDYDLLSIVGRSPRLQSVLVKIAQVASMNIPVLIEGESGTGKELLARALHMNSDRRSSPFIAINCGAIPEQLLASELFGYERGAFTGATRTTPGKFEAAHNGTIFLDEVSELPQPIQVALLRVLQSGEFYRLGSTVPRRTDARLVAATNRHLNELVQTQEFRQDLYYRLNVVRIVVPPLRERPEDIPLLVAHFIRKFNAATRKELRTISPEAFEVLARCAFPGNVRELENAIQYAVATAAGDIVQVDDLPEEIRSGASSGNGHSVLHTLDDVRAAQDRIEREYLERLLRAANGNISVAAKQAGLNRTYLHALLNRHAIKADSFRARVTEPEG